MWIEWVMTGQQNENLVVGNGSIVDMKVTLTGYILHHKGLLKFVTDLRVE